MKIKPADLTANINKNNPFSDCKLGREYLSYILTNVITSYPDGFVFAINNKWGTGKTTFIRMWQQNLENNGYKTIYFNAWENDFDQNPLVAILSELKALSDSSSKKFFDSLLPNAAILAKNTIPALFRAALKQYGIAEVIEGVAKGTMEVFEKEIDEYKKKKQTITEFRKELETFVSKTSGDKPLIFFIDELDRCRPDYAVELLEQIKHLFTVKGIVFVLSIDKEQLGHAIRGFYGNDRIDAEEYLRRFIDLEYSIPSPTTQTFCSYLYDYYSFDAVFQAQERIKHKAFYNDKDSFLDISTMLLNGATLRQQEQIYGFTRLIVSSFATNEYIFPDLLFALIFMKMMTPELYTKISTNSLTIQELADEFEKLIPDELLSVYTIRSMLYLEAKLLHFYNKQKGTRKQLVEDDKETGAKTTFIQTKLKLTHENFADILWGVTLTFDRHDTMLSDLINKIDRLN